MPNPRKASVVDGFTTLTAARRAIDKSAKDKAPAKKRSGPGSGRKKAKKPEPGVHIARTALPSKQEIYCYECTYVFSVTGQSSRTVCPKCRAVLERTSPIIDSEWSAEIKTAGTVHVKPTGVIAGGFVLANDIILEGTVRAGTVQAFRRLELRAGAVFPEHLIQAKDLIIAAKSSFRLEQDARCRDLDVHGELDATVYAEGLVTVRANGRLRGEIHTAHLNVEDGGRLEARVFLERHLDSGANG
ncbi:MAG: polymer-forming cytoskeletal protein [Kiritimatiellae bacterium]|nr:polymer-forming cytoskeletal protein [Kiritimatiellia bacterium]